MISGSGSVRVTSIRGEHVRLDIWPLSSEDDAPPSITINLIDPAGDPVPSSSITTTVYPRSHWEVSISGGGTISFLVSPEPIRSSTSQPDEEDLSW